MKRRPNLWNAFRDGTQFRLGGGRIVTMRSDDAGSLALPSGSIVAADPLFDLWQAPLTTSVSPGQYPIHVALADRDVALVLVRLSDRKPAKWARAKPSRFSVDGATGCLMDRKVARYLRKQAEANKYDRHIKRFDDALAENGDYGSTQVAAIPDATIFVFRAWGGDGAFPVFFGYDAGGELACLVVDMLLDSTDAELV